MYLEGRIQSRKYQGKDGIERTAYEIIANEMKMLGGGNSEQQAQAEAPTPPRRQAPATPAAPVEDVDDDIPF